MITKEQIMLALLPHRIRDDYEHDGNTSLLVRVEKEAEDLLADWKEHSPSGWALTPKGLGTLLDMLQQDCPMASFGIARVKGDWTLWMAVGLGLHPYNQNFKLKDYSNWFSLADAIRAEYGSRVDAH